MDRRHFFTGAATAVAAASVSRVALAALPDAHMQSSTATAAPLMPPDGRPYNPVVTLNGWTLPWRMNANVKEFHLVAEPVVREMAPGFKVNMWGYNGQSPGPTIEVVEGDPADAGRDDRGSDGGGRAGEEVAAVHQWAPAGGGATLSPDVCRALTPAGELPVSASCRSVSASQKSRCASMAAFTTNMLARVSASSSHTLASMPL